MLVFFFIILLAILTILVLIYSSNKGEQFTNLDFINLSNPDNNQSNLLDDPMPKEFIITNSQYSFYKKEVKRTDFIKILNDLKDKNKYTLAIEVDKFKPVDNIIDPITLNYFKKYILDQLSILVHSYDQNYGYHHIWFNEQATKLINYKNYKDETSNLDYFELKMIVGRRDKSKVFNIAISGVYDLLNDKVYIISSKLIGLTTDEYSKSGFFEYNQNKINDFDKKGVHCSLSNRKECKIDSLSQEEMEKYNKANDDLKWEMNNSKCFFKEEANNKIDCLSKNIKGATGIWDTKCRYDTDCPFFGSNGNLNYNNNRGKCKVDGYCELPLGMVPIGYRLYRKGDKYKPLCHNCEPTKECIGIGCSKCCDKQKQDGKNPDYAFDNDIIERDTKENKEALNNLGLKVFDLKLR